ncbi:MAG: hypothetical protein DCC50_01400 [Acidobacteria bacterium]|nr:MAG: hypothetical protein DCC50_01400 [Acidobacteriota bacterium]
MGFFDKVKDALTTSDAERAANAREAAGKAQQEADEAAPDAADKQAEASTQYRTHTVKAGDTLSGIAASYGVDWRKMAKLNKLDNPDLIYPGQVFKVPHD